MIVDLLYSCTGVSKCSLQNLTTPKNDYIDCLCDDIYNIHNAAAGGGLTLPGVNGCPYCIYTGQILAFPKLQTHTRSPCSSIMDVIGVIKKTFNVIISWCYQVSQITLPITSMQILQAAVISSLQFPCKYISSELCESTVNLPLRFFDNRCHYQRPLLLVFHINSKVLIPHINTYPTLPVVQSYDLRDVTQNHPPTHQTRRHSVSTPTRAFRLFSDMAIDSKGCGWLLFKAYWGVIILSTPLAFAGPTKAQLPSQRVSHGETARSCLGEEELLTDSPSTQIQLITTRKKCSVCHCVFSKVCHPRVGELCDNIAFRVAF